MMKRDASKSPEQALGLPDETQAAPSADDRVAERLRGFGPLGILAMIVIISSSNNSRHRTGALRLTSQGNKCAQPVIAQVKPKPDEHADNDWEHYWK
jgi:hypothetical protein